MEPNPDTLDEDGLPLPEELSEPHLQDQSDICEPDCVSDHADLDGLADEVDEEIPDDEADQPPLPPPADALPGEAGPGGVSPDEEVEERVPEVVFEDDEPDDSRLFDDELLEGQLARRRKGASGGAI